MSVSHPAPTTEAGAAGTDPSMEDILASIRRILSEEEEQKIVASGHDEADEVLDLDESMLVPLAEPAPFSSTAAPPPPSQPLPIAEPPPAVKLPASEPLVAPAAAAMATAAMGDLVRSLQSERAAPVYRGGPTLEDLVREELRPLLKSWLDTHLPGMVERVVRSEIERLAGRAGV